MKKITQSILMGLAFITIAPNARSEIASQAYVDDQDEKVIMGTMTEMYDSLLSEEMGMSAQEIQSAKSALPDAGLYGVYTMTYLQNQRKQDKIQGGGNYNGKVVTATNTAGSVDYTAIDATPTADSNNLVTSGGVASAIASAVSSAIYDDTALAGRVSQVEDGMYSAVSAASQPQSGILISDNGSVKITNGGYVEDQNIKTTANIQMGKIAFPTPQAACETAGCMLMYVDGQYTWEEITRDSGESVSVVAANAVDATATGTNSTGTHARGVFYNEPVF